MREFSVLLSYPILEDGSQVIEEVHKDVVLQKIIEDLKKNSMSRPGFSYKNRVLSCENRLVISAQSSRIHQLFLEFHTSLQGGYSGFNMGGSGPMFIGLIAEWGRMSMCDAERRLLANALLDISNEWFILLSESCIPLYKFSVVYHYVMKSKHSFIGAFDDPGPFGRGRYNPNMAPLVDITKWRKGSQWFEVNRKLAINIVEDTTFYLKFEQYCRPACYVDEHYFPTMLTIQAPGALANRSITWVDWSRGGAHPATFGRTDISEEFFDRVRGGHECLYNNNRNSSVCFLFARKFAPSALEPLLDMVDSKVLDF